MMQKYFFILIFTSFIITQVYGESKRGLVGILYEDIELSRMSSIWYIESLNSSEITWQTKNDFSAKWRGFIKAPVSGEVSFYGEADNEIKLIVDGKIIVDTWAEENIYKGKIKLKKDRLYSIKLLYRQISGESFMRIFWSGKELQKEIIPVNALYFDQKLEDTILKEFKSETNIDLSQLKFDVSSTIDIFSPEDIIKKRESLVSLLWAENGFPSNKLPDSVVEGISDKDFESLENLKQINKLWVNMEFGLNSIVYHFIPKISNGSAAIYHQGHGGKFSLGIRTINEFLKKGYNVYALSMPLLGMNNKPIVSLQRFGKLSIYKHTLMAFLSPDIGHSLKYFMNPVAATVNYAQKFHYEKLIMIGLSGGGWTTTLYSAIDPRIKISFPVAGSLPLYLRAQDISHSGSLGDFEQLVPELYNKANYLELYIMGAYGEERMQIQILNEFDACCFSGTGYKTYENILKNRIETLGAGKYDIFLDSTHQLHQISPTALEVIFGYLENEF